LSQRLSSLEFPLRRFGYFHSERFFSINSVGAWRIFAVAGLTSVALVVMMVWLPSTDRYNALNQISALKQPAALWLVWRFLCLHGCSPPTPVDCLSQKYVGGLPLALW